MEINNKNAQFDNNNMLHYQLHSVTEPSSGKSGLKPSSSIHD